MAKHKDLWWFQYLDSVIADRPTRCCYRALSFSYLFNDLFYLPEMTDVCNVAEDTTFFACDINLKFHR